MCMSRDGLLHGAENVAVIELGKIARQAALNADFGGPELPRFDGFASHVVESVEVGVGLARAAAEGAELASHETDVGEIDVAVDHVGDDVAGEFGAKQVGRDQQAEEVVAFGSWPAHTTLPATSRRRSAFRGPSPETSAPPESGAGRYQTSRAKGRIQVLKV